jgi:Fis family transcriptional regulator
MTKAEPLATQAAANDDATEYTRQDVPPNHLRDAVTASVRQYLRELDGQMTTDFYDLVLAQVEAPLLEEIMAHTRNNQTRASIMLGLNRGTLRKKLKQYKLINSDKN